MRVLIFSNWFPPVQSGSSFYASSLARALSARGNDVAVVTLDWGSPYAPPSDTAFPIYTLSVRKIPESPLFFNLNLMGISFTRGNIKRMKAILREHRTEILHHVNHIFDSTLLTARAARSLGIPVVGSITTPIQHDRPLRHNLMRIADQCTVGWFGVRHWDRVVSLDRSVHNYVGDRYGAAVQARSTVIPFGVREETLASFCGTTPVRSGRPQILMVGHIHPLRNPTQLVRAMTKVIQEFPGARLVLAGRVDLDEPVRAARSLGLDANQVEFCGEVPHDKTIELMKSSHALVSWLNGPYKSLGTAAMEAMLCQTPVIHDLPENLFGEGKLRNGENTVIVDSRSPESIAGAILRLLKDETLRRQIGAAGRRFVLEEFDWSRLAGRMESFYERVLAQRGIAAAPARPLDVEPEEAEKSLAAASQRR
jgi:glycosyltransferase involved in cell wall biosynthesis